MTNDLERWLTAIVEGESTMSQRGVRWVDNQGGLETVVAAAKGRGVHIVRLTDDRDNELITASLHPFEVLC